RVFLSMQHGSAAPRDPPSFPTRRSSDLRGTERGNAGCFVTSTFFCAAKTAGTCARWPTGTERCCAALPAGWTTPPGTVTKPSGRSEEHTSELQSRFDLVCRLLLEKKNST